MRRGIARAAVATTAGIALITMGIAGASASRAALRSPRVMRGAGRAPQVPSSPGGQVWASRYNGSGNDVDFAESLAVSPSGETVFVTGFSNQGTATGFDYATVAYSAATGAQLWVKHYHGPGSGNSSDIAHSVAVSPDGGTVFVTGESAGANKLPDYATVAYNAATGAQLWVKRYSGPGDRNDMAKSVVVSPDGGTVLVTGSSQGASGFDYATVTYNAVSGAQLWVKRYNGPGNGDDEASALRVSPSGGTVFVTGSSTGATSGEDYATIAYNAATGAQQWAKRYNGHGDDSALSVAVSPDGGTVFVTGQSDGTNLLPDYATVAYNAATGAQRWVKRYNGPGNSNDLAYSAAVSPDGGTVYVTGESDGTTSGSDQATIAYNAATGARRWVKRYNGPGNDNDGAFSVAVSPSGGTVYVTGSSHGTTSSDDYATVAYGAATGAQLWASSYNGPGNAGDSAFSVAVSPSGGTVFVTGDSDGKTTVTDWATVAYSG